MAQGSDATTASDPGAQRGARVGGTDREPVIAGYHLRRMLGRGGMGTVWEAFEHRLERRVALKVLDEVPDETVHAEARITARIDDPGIVRVHDFGYTLDGRPYYTMELVQGVDLAALMADGPLAPIRAVGIAADLARALDAVHEHGVVHRDLTPRNVLVDEKGRARILDFGIAFVARAQRHAPATGICGTPAYMAPEQALGLEPTPQTDIHALGVLLYQMLTGRRPFSGSGDALLQAIATEVPTPPSEVRREIHEDLDAVVLKCLEKVPSARFANARSLDAALRAIAEGGSIDVSGERERVPTARARTDSAADRPRLSDSAMRFRWTLDLASPPERLWPLVADTDRFNEAVGSTPFEFVDDLDAEGRPKRTGRTKTFGLALEWVEQPFEWVVHQEHSVLRTYRRGPLRAIWNHVTLTPTSSGGTKLVHHVSVDARGPFAAAATRLAIARTLGRGLERVYRRIDEATAQAIDPFAKPHVPSASERHHVEQGAEALAARGFERDLVARLSRFLLDASDHALSRIRPFEIARRWRAPRGVVLDLLLHGVDVGLLTLGWDVLCPKCLIAHESLDALEQVRRVGQCIACAYEYERDLASSVELIMKPSARVRPTSRPVFCAGAPALRPHVLAQQVLAPGASRTLTMDVPRGRYLATGTLLEGWELIASAIGHLDACALTVTRGAAKDELRGNTPVLRAGRVTLTLRNETQRAQTVRIEVEGGREDGVSAAMATSHTTFRKLFGDELLMAGQHVNVSRMAFVLVAVDARAELVEKEGDVRACELMSVVDEIVRGAARAAEGAVVPGSLEGWTLAFATSKNAVEAAVEIQRTMRGRSLPCRLRIAINEGRCLALTHDETIEYFGQTVERALGLVAQCPPGSVALTGSVADDRASMVLLHEREVPTKLTTSAEGRRLVLAHCAPPSPGP